MTIKNTTLGGTDWSDGDVLYAADQNDTFDATIGTGNTFISPLIYKSHSGWGSRTQSSAYFYSGSLTAGGADAAYVLYDVTLLPGTYRVDFCGVVGTSYGIMDVLIDDVEVGSLDWYNGAGSANNFKSITGITVSTSGTIELKLLIDGKNGSSSSYDCRIQGIQITRTGN